MRLASFDANATGFESGGILVEEVSAGSRFGSAAAAGWEGGVPGAGLLAAGLSWARASSAPVIGERRLDCGAEFSSLGVSSPSGLRSRSRSRSGSGSASPSDPRFAGMARRSPMSLKDLVVATLRVMIAARRDGVKCFDDWGRFLGFVIFVLGGLGVEGVAPPAVDEETFGFETLDLEFPPRLLDLEGGFDFGFGFVVAGVGARAGMVGVFAVIALWFGIWPSWGPLKGGPGGGR